MASGGKPPGPWIYFAFCSLIMLLKAVLLINIDITRRILDVVTYNVEGWRQDLFLWVKFVIRLFNSLWIVKKQKISMWSVKAELNSLWSVIV